MRTSRVTSIRRIGFAASLALCSAVANAQLPNASTAAFAMGGNFTAMARGYEAVAWNPATLAMPERPAFDLDTYKILVRALAQKQSANSVKVRKLPSCTLLSPAGAAHSEV